MSGLGWEDAVPGDEDYWRDVMELGLRVADGLLTEDEGGIVWRAQIAQMEAMLKLELQRGGDAHA